MSKGAKSSGRMALVTGGARRIGAVIAEALHAEGCDVIIHYRNSEADARDLAGRLNADRPDSAHLVRADLVADDGPARLAEQVASIAPRLTLLVNNASRFYPTPIGQASYDDWKALMGSNARGPFFLTQALRESLRGGAVVNVLDIHAQRPLRAHTIYCMAKAALGMMTLSLARELAPDVRVNAVAPGAILWPEAGAGAESERTRQAILDRTALGRVGSPGDVAGAVVFLGLHADYVTGQVLAVDGGRSLYV